MRTAALWLLVLVIGAVASPASQSAPPTSPCRPQSDTTVAFLQTVLYYRNLALEEHHPESMFMGVSQEDIRYVTEDSLCAVAVSAVNARTTDPAHSLEAVFLIQVGLRGYWVLLPGITRNEYILFSEDWTYMLTLVG
jgi:hypothetical protein